MTIREAKKIAVQKFAASPIHAITTTPALDASLLIAYVTGFDRSQMILQRDKELTTEQEQQFFAAVSKRETGLPIAYITGHKEFFGLDFIVTPDVLIPKPDTEILVEKTLDVIGNNYKSLVTSYKRTEDNSTFPFSPFSSHLNICDMCTGSGCVGISIINNLQTKIIDNGQYTIDNYLLDENKLQNTSNNTQNLNDNYQFSIFNFQLTLTDISAAALAVARKNAERLLSAEQLANTKFLQGDLFDAVDDYADTGDAPITKKTLNDNAHEKQPRLFDIIVSNPPYIPSRMVDELLQDGRSEPRIALDGDASSGAASPATRTNNGLSIIRRLVPQSFAHLNDGGYFLCETGEYNAHETADIFKTTGFSEVTIFDDLAGTPRVVCGRKHNM